MPVKFRCTFQSTDKRDIDDNGSSTHVLSILGKHNPFSDKRDILPNLLEMRNKSNALRWAFDIELFSLLQSDVSINWSRMRRAAAGKSETRHPLSGNNRCRSQTSPPPLRCPNSTMVKRFPSKIAYFPSELVDARSHFPRRNTFLSMRVLIPEASAKFVGPAPAMIQLLLSTKSHA